MNQKGHITLVACLVTFMLSVLLLIATLHSLKTLERIKTRSSTYLCFREQNYYLLSYVKEMSLLNKVILVTNAARFLPEPTVIKAAEAAKKAALIKQSFHHLSYLKKIKLSKFCSWANKAIYIKNLPYKTHLLTKLVRDSKGTTVVGKKKWVNVINSITQSRYKNLGFILKIDYSLKSPFEKGLKFKRREILNLKSAFGWHSFFSSSVQL